MAWKPIWKPARAPLQRHLVQLWLLKLRQSGVAGIVRIGRLHRRGPRAQRPIHKALQHARVQHRVVSVVVRAHGLQLLQRSNKRQPFGNAHIELALFLHFLEDQEILPVAEVLNAGHPVCHRIGNGQFVALAPLFVARWRNQLRYQRFGRLAQNARGLARRVQVDGASLRRFRLAGDARRRQRR